jgi:hypothetical protein
MIDPLLDVFASLIIMIVLVGVALATVRVQLSSSRRRRDYQHWRAVQSLRTMGT